MICEEIKVQCTVQMRRFDTLISALNSNNGDAIIASIAQTPEMRARVDFSDPYYRTPARFVALRNSPIDDVRPEALEGKKIAAIADSAYIPVSFHNPFGPVATAAAVQLDACTAIAQAHGVPLREVLEAALETTRPLLQAQRQTVSLAVPSEPIYLDGDPVRLAQVFANLLSNAAKYSNPDTKVRLSAVLADGGVVVDVLDEGIGIAPEMVPHVFEMFSQASPAIGRSQGGLGIGLALVKGLVDLHGGTVTAESEGPGLGAVFTVRLAVQRDRRGAPAGYGGTAGAAPLERAFELAGLRVLVVDDNGDDGFTSTPQGPGGCTDTCRDANDGFCDDGGEGADFGLCEYGTDCGDCGERPAN